jgi:3-hydroxymyristoyl/3-hydroxydecanoyl-(acyl carrier protein) dehydratase
MLDTTLAVSGDHPALPGHFPGQPLVPAVVILDLVMAAIARQQPALRIDGVNKLKVLRQLPPGQAFRLQCGEPRGESLRFKCWVDAELLAEGNLRLAPAPQLEPSETPVA